MSDNQLDNRAGAVCDALDEALAQLEPSESIAISHLYVARHLLLTHVENRPTQTSPTAVAELAAAEDAIERARDEITSPQQSQVGSNLREIALQVRTLCDTAATAEAEHLGWSIAVSNFDYREEKWESTKSGSADDSVRNE